MRGSKTELIVRRIETIGRAKGPKRFAATVFPPMTGRSDSEGPTSAAVQTCAT